MDQFYEKNTSFQSLPSENQLVTSELLLKEGWIRKKGSRFFSKWPRRYFLLENKCLYCYVSSNKEKFLGGINFDKISVYLKTFDKKQEIMLYPLSGQGFLGLKFEKKQDFDEWLELLENHIKSSEGVIKDLINVPLWTLSRISINEFYASAESGDILLFKSKNFANSIQRVFSLSEYDHIGILYKYPTGDIAFLESTKESGVSICYWEDFLINGWGHGYTKIVYRKLELLLKNPLLSEQLNLFIKQFLGKKFGFGSKKLLSRFTKINFCSNDKFFCSELVAKAYQELGLLSKYLQASSFWPGDFSESSKMKIIGGKLQQEKIIDFEIKESVLMKI